MEKFNNSSTQKEIQALREGIKRKYRTYNLLNRDRFPIFAYNTNRANYEPLAESFREEFYVIRGFDTSDRDIHIPSTNTLAQLFCDEDYLPGKKILNTCQAYADELSSETGIVDTLTASPRVVTVPVKTVSLLLAGIVLVALLFVYIISKPALGNAPPASGLLLNRPSNGRVVPMELLAVGTVLNAQTVWVVIRPKGSNQYFVQPPMKVGDDHTWRGVIYVGSVNMANVGVAFQVRAFVNPVATLKEGDLLHSWPQAELATGIVEVIRGAQTE
ncbi:hypothetical protein [Spirosoma spitsbergense]|uniref:hypothetical protein n=1 Tax=Spirosoma spitsbergense TaxID=431554 RepID=UPI00037C332A|nr:hypothetical protein [Spirosoma spitsbergense]